MAIRNTPRKPNGRLDRVLSYTQTSVPRVGNPLIPEISPNLIRYAIRKVFPEFKPILPHLFIELGSSVRTSRDSLYKVDVYIKQGYLARLLRDNGYEFNSNRVYNLAEGLYVALAVVFKSTIQSRSIDRERGEFKFSYKLIPPEKWDFE